MRIGVYGGTFNPIHLGHVHILREFIGRLDLQKVLLIPDGTPPHKVAEDLAPPEAGPFSSGRADWNGRRRRPRFREDHSHRSGPEGGCRSFRS